MYDQSSNSRPPDSYTMLEWPHWPILPKNPGDIEGARDLLCYSPTFSLLRASCGWRSGQRKKMCGRENWIQNLDSGTMLEGPPLLVWL
jgi:hypothetical protein